MDKSPDAFRTISEVAEDLDVPQHVLRFWETRFNQIKPLKRGGGRRYYRPDDVGLLKGIRRLLYGEGYTIKGVQRILKEQGARHVIAIGLGAPLNPEPGPDAPARPQPAPPPPRASLQPAMPAPPRPMPRSEPLEPPQVERPGVSVVAQLKAALFELGEARSRLAALTAGDPGAEELMQR